MHWRRIDTIGHGQVIGDVVSEVQTGPLLRQAGLAGRFEYIGIKTLDHEEFL